MKKQTQTLKNKPKTGICEPLSTGVPGVPESLLSEEARGLWKIILTAYELEQPALTVLQVGLEALEQLRSAEKIIQDEGQVYLDRWGQPRQHPALLNARDSRSAFLKCISSLGLDLEPLQSGPSGSK